MILGIGQDVCDATRIRSTINRFGARFTHRIYTQNERNKCEARRNKVDCYARRFAAKEACSKALGVGFRNNINFNDIDITNDKKGKPLINISNNIKIYLKKKFKLNKYKIFPGGALLRLQSLCPSGLNPSIELSITDDRRLAFAIVIVSGIEKSFS